jgi:hypothetical protein
MLRRSLWIALLAIAGCGSSDSTHSVSGTVTVGGQPAAGALVLFHPVGEKTQFANKPYATVAEDGTYTLTTFSDRPDGGAPAGEYKVTIWWPGTAKAAAKSEVINLGGESEKAVGAGEDRLKGKYNNAATTPLKATVKSGSNSIPFEL